MRRCGPPTAGHQETLAILDRRRLFPWTVTALAIRLAATGLLVASVPALRVFARTYTVPDRIACFVTISALMAASDLSARRAHRSQAVSLSACAMTLNLINTVISIVTLMTPLVAVAAAGTARCAPFAAALCGQGGAPVAVLLSLGLVYTIAVLINALYCVSHTVCARELARTAAIATAAA